MNVTSPKPLVSVVILNWNAAQWIPRCLESLRQQTIFSQIEIIFTDNASSDDSEKIAREGMTGWPNGKFVQNGGNFGFAGGCNRGAAATKGKYLFFLNPDVWLEPDCLEELAGVGEKTGTPVVAPMILDYADDTVQWWLDDGFDLSGWTVNARFDPERTTSFSGGTFAFIRADFFWKLGGYDEAFFMYGEEEDLGWRIWIGGGNVATAPQARVHHRGAAAVNPEGGEQIVELRTSERKRFYANRNHLLALLKHSRHFLLLTVLPFIGLLFLESFFWLVATRRWSLARATSWEPLWECWKLRNHVRAKRKQVQGFRWHGDWWMLRFFCWRFGRSNDLKKILKFGRPKI
ncbi:MAG TPA: glycosyltransferase family 2 protein [Verrucomicrobiae bacterium]